MCHKQIKEDQLWQSNRVIYSNMLEHQQEYQQLEDDLQQHWRLKHQ
jgi:hypothetical protein